MDILGTIGWRTEVDDSGAEAGIRRAEERVRTSLARVDNMEATAKAGLDLRELEEQIVVAKRQLLELEKTRPEPEAELETTKFNAELKKLKAQLAELGQRRAEVGVRYRGLTAARREAEALTAEHFKLQDAARKVTAEQRKSTVELRKQGVEVDRLRHRYGQMLVQLNRLENIRPSFRRTPLQELELARIRTEMDSTAARVRSLGGDVDDISGDIDRHTSTLRRWGSSLANIRVHAGFVSLTLRQFGLALITLGPIIEGVIGSLSALVGVLLEGIAGGAAFGGAALTALGLNIFGITQAIKPYATQLGAAIDATNEYTEAVLVSGKNSEEAKDAYKAMQQTLRGMPPAVAKTASAFADLKARWIDLTQGARRPFFDIIQNALKSANRLLPEFAHNIVHTMNRAEGASQGFFKVLEGPLGKSLDGIMDNFSDALGPFVRGLSNIGVAVGRVFESASRFFKPAAEGFRDWALGVKQASGDTSSLNSTMDDLMESASQVVGTLGAGGRTAWKFFTTGAGTGRDILQDLTDWFNKTSDWIDSTEGQASLQEWFADAYDTGKDVWSLLVDIVGVGADIADAFQPILNTMVDIAAAVVDVVDAISHIPVLGGTIMDVLGFGVAGAGVLALAKRIPGVSGALSVLGRTVSSAAPAMLGWGRATESAGVAAGRAVSSTSTFARSTSAAASSASRSVGTFSRFGGVVSTAGRGIASAAGAAASFVGPVGLAVGAGLLLIDSFAQQQEQAAALAEQYNAAIDATQDLAEALGNTSTRTRGLRSLWLQLRDALAGGGPEARAAIMQVRGEIDTMRTNARDARQQLEDLWAAGTGRDVTNSISAMDDYEDRFQNIADINPVDGINTWQDAMGKLLNSIQRTGVVTENWKAKLAEAGASQSEIDALSDAIGEDYTKSARKAANATDEVNLALLNLQRARKGLDTLPNKAAAGITKLQRQLGSGFVTKQFLKFDDRQATSQVASLSSKLTSLGQGNIVKRVLVQADGAKEALRMLQLIDSKDLRGKTLSIKDVGGSKLVAEIAALNGAKLKPKVLQLLGDDRGAITAVSSVIAASQGIHSIVMAITALDNATGIINAAANAARIADSITAVIDVVTRYSSQGSPGKYGGGIAYAGGAFATGGQIDRAMERAETFAPRRGSGAYSRPTYLVGEENRREYVIATNPAYRRSNIGYLRQAAEELGMWIMPGYAKGKGHPNRSNAKQPMGGKGKNKGKDKPEPYSAPPAYVEGSIELGVAENDLFAAQSAWDRANTKLRSDIQMKNQLQQQLKQLMHTPPKQRVGGFSYQTSTLSKRIKTLTGKTIPKDRAALKAAEKALEEKKVNVGAVREINNEWTRLESVISEAQSYMTVAQTGGDEAGFNYWRAVASTGIGDLQNLYAKAANNDNITKRFKAELLARIGALAADNATLATFEGSEESIDQFVERLQRTGEQQSLEANLAVAEATTPDDETDDIAARGALRSFWSQILAAAQGTGSSTLIRDAAQALTGYQESGSGSGGSSAPTLGEQIVSSNAARLELFRNFGSNLATSPGMQAIQGGILAGGAAVGSADYNPSGVTTQQGGRSVSIGTYQNVFPTAPPDPHTWSRQQEWELRTL